MFFVALTPASAVYTETKYAYGSTYGKLSDEKDHYRALFLIPHNTVPFSQYSPYIGGTNLYVVKSLLNHRDPQKWEFSSRTQVSTNWDRAELMVPSQYVWTMEKSRSQYLTGTMWYNSIYIKYQRP